MTNEQNKLKLPSRWLMFPKYSRIGGTRFIASKTPLPKEYDFLLTPEQRYTPDDLIREVPDIGLVVCLVFGKSLYDCQDFISKNIEYFKINVSSHSIKASTYHAFQNKVNRFLSKAPKDKLICVHCSHGLNRTGFFICQYMINNMGYKSSEAIQLFETSRGYKMERKLFITKLKMLDETKGEESSTPSRDDQYHANSWNSNAAGYSSLSTNRTFGRDHVTKRVT